MIEWIDLLRAHVVKEPLSALGPLFVLVGAAWTFWRWWRSRPSLVVTASVETQEDYWEDEESRTAGVNKSDWIDVQVTVRGAPTTVLGVRIVGYAHDWRPLWLQTPALLLQLRDNYRPDGMPQLSQPGTHFRFAGDPWKLRPEAWKMRVFSEVQHCLSNRWTRSRLRLPESIN